MISKPPRLILLSLLLMAVLMLQGCGSSGGGESGSDSLPVQNPVTPTSALLSGRVELPGLFNLDNLSVNAALGSIDSQANPYAGFVVEARYLSSGNQMQVRTGTVDPQTGTYVVRDLPLGVELQISLRKGRLQLERLVEPLGAENAEIIRNVNVRSTAESVLVRRIREQGNSSDLQSLRALDSFAIEVSSLSEVLNGELRDENLGDEAPILTERARLVRQVENSAEGVIGSRVPNQLPWVVFEAVDASQRANVRLQFSLNDREGDRADLRLSYSVDGSSFTTLSQSAGEFLPLNGLQTSSSAVYSVLWATALDLGAGVLESVQVRAEVWPEGRRDEASKTEAKTRIFEVDNRGLPNVSSLQPASQIVGQPLTLQVFGDQFQRVERVYLEYTGEESFIRPRTVELPFVTISPQQIQADLGAFDLFPVEYHVSVVDQEDFQSVSIPTLQVEEDLLPTVSSSSLNPTSGLVDQPRKFTFRGTRIGGVYGERVFLRHQTLNQNIGIEAIGATLLSSSTGEMLWEGRIPQGIPAGVWDIFIDNSCSTCGGPIPLGSGPSNQWLAKEPQAEVDSLVVSSSSIPDLATNDQSHTLILQGRWLSSVNQAAISSSSVALQSDFSSQTALTVMESTTGRVLLNLPVGFPSGDWWVAVKNDGGIGLAPARFSVREGVVESVNVSVHGGSNLNSPISGTPPVGFNNSRLYLRLDGQRLSSLSEVQFVNLSREGIEYATSPFRAEYTLGGAEIPRFMAPGVYGLSLTNEGGTQSFDCSGGGCLEVRETGTTVFGVRNSTATAPLTEKQVLSSESALMVLSGVALSGFESARLVPATSSQITGSGLSLSRCRVQGFEPSDSPAVPVQADYFGASFSIGPSQSLIPGCYVTELLHSNSGWINLGATVFDVLERPPSITQITPVQAGTNTLGQSDFIIRGSGLFGAESVYFFRMSTDVADCSQASSPAMAARSMARNQFEAVSPSSLKLPSGALQAAGLSPGTWLVGVRNRSFPSLPGSEISACEPNRARLTITEPQLEFAGFPSTSALLPSTVQASSSTAPVLIAGSYLSGLRDARLVRRFDITNVATEFSSEIVTASFSVASLRFATGLLPGDYDLHLTNSSGLGPVRTGLVTVIEDSAPVPERLEVASDDTLNTHDIFLQLYGQHMESLALQTSQISVSLAQRDLCLRDLRSSRSDVESTRCVNLALSDVRQVALPDGTRYLELKVPQGFYGGDYELEVANMTGLRASPPVTYRLTVHEPVVDFSTVSVLKQPGETEFGFGENDRKLKLDIRGDHLASVDQIRLELEDPFESGLSSLIVLDHDVIHRIYDSSGVSLVTTIGRFQRPGSYNLRLRNNSGEFSPIPEPITSKFSQQVQIREGGPRLVRSGCLDMQGVCDANPPLSGDSSCQPSSISASLETSRNVDSTRDLKLAGCNFFTLSKVRLYRQGSLIPELSWDIPQLGDSLEGSGVLTRATAAIELELPQFLKYIGAYDVQITNSASSRRFAKRLRSIETFKATINGVFPTQLSNTTKTTLNVSGDHLTGTTRVALWSVDSGLQAVTEILELDFTRNSENPLNFLNADVGQGLRPGNYRLRIDNSVGFNAVPQTNLLTMTEAALQVTTFSSVDLMNDSTRTLTVYGEGFMGVDTSTVNLVPATDAVYSPLNAQTLIPVTTVSLSGVNIVSRTLMHLEVPAHVLPGYYRLGMENTVSSGFLSARVLRIREIPPSIDHIDPDSRSYAQNTTVAVNGDAFLGARGGTSGTYTRLNSVFGSIERTVDTQIVDDANMILEVPENLAIGEYEVEIRNTEGVANSRVVTRLTIREDLASVNLLTPETVAYDADFSSQGVDFFGLNFQGVNSIELSTSTTAGAFSYDFEVPCPGLIPYVAMQACKVSTASILYPAVYDVSVSNSAGTTVLTQTLEVQIPSSTIDSFTNEGPLNSDTEIVLTGEHLRRFEILRMIATSGTETCDALSSADPRCSLREVSNTEARLIFNFPSAIATSFRIEYQTYGDRLAGIGPRYLEFFTRTGNVPEITSITYADGAGLPTTSDFVGAAAAVKTTHIQRGLPQDFIISGNHFKDIQRVELWKDSQKFTLACTTEFGVGSLNKSTDSTLPLFVPKELFTYNSTLPPLPIGGGVCLSVNTTGPTRNVMSPPLRPGVYSIVLVGRDNNKVLNSGKQALPAQFYFGEDRPSQVSVNVLSPTTFNNQDLSFEVLGQDLGGTDQIRIFRSLAPAFEVTYAVHQSQITSLTRLSGVIPKGTIRGLKDPNFPYFFQLRNSRGWIDTATPIFRIGEEQASLTTVNPPSGRNNVGTTATLSGLNLLGAGQITGGAPLNPVRNQVRMIYKKGAQSADITSETVDLSTSVVSQNVESLVVEIPSQLRPGEWFFSVENDYASTVGNPLVATEVTFTVVDSAVQVTDLTPTTSAFDVLPATMTLFGQSLGGMHTLTLTHQDSSLGFSKTLSLVSSPDVTAATWGSASFTLPQSPEFLIPGHYGISVENPTEAVTLPNFELDILERAPLISDLNASQYSNATTQRLDILGQNLFGRPRISLERIGSETETLPITGIEQSADRLNGLTLPMSLYPDTWRLSLQNSVGSTTFDLVVTEPLPVVNELIPNQVPFDFESPIRILGDYMLGVQSSADSVVLSDLIRTPLIGVLPLDRYEVAAVVPQGVNVGRYEVLVSNRTGRNSTSAMLTVQGSGLSVSGFSPQTAPRSGDVSLVLSGSGFRRGARVTFGGAAAWDVEVFENHLEMRVPPAPASVDFTEGTSLVEVQVYNPDGEFVSAADSFLYVARDPGAPALETMVPGAVESGAGEPSGIPLNSRVALRFNQSMRSSSLTTFLGTGPGAYRSVQVLSAGGAIGGTLSASEDQRWFVFDAQGNNYVANDRVEIGLSSVLKGANDRDFVTTDTIRLSSSFFERDSFIEDWSFVTGSTVDSASLGVSGVDWDPAPQTPITVRFNKPLNPLSLRDEDFILKEIETDRIIAVRALPGPDLENVVLDPVERRVSGLDYELKVNADHLQSLTGNSMSGSYFDTISTAESGPQVLSVIPAHGTTDVLLNRTLIFEFDQAVDPTTVNTSTIHLRPLTGEPVLAELRHNSTKRIFTLRPQDFLQPDEDYVFEVNRGVKSVTGVFAAQAVTSGFQTVAQEQVDTSAPVVASVRPLNGESQVAVDTEVEIVFSEIVHPADLSSENLKLYQSSEAVDVSLLTSASGQQVRMVPSANLEFGTMYDVFIAANMHDLADNTSDISVEVSFSTTGLTDDNRPSIVSSTPSSGSQNVSTGVTIVLNYSEPLDASTVSSQDFQIVGASGTAVDFGFSFNGTSVVTLNPLTGLARGTRYRVEAGTEMTDLSGNASHAAVVTFETEAFTDLIPPEITLLTVNGLPHCLNGDDYNCSSTTQSILQTMVIEVPENGFTIDVTYEDPGLEGESSGILASSLAITNEKQIFDSQNNSFIAANSNLVLQSGAVVEQDEQRARLFIPPTWQFQDGLQILRATIRDGSAQGNLSDVNDPRAQYRFQVVSRASDPQSYGFENGPHPFALDFSRDRLQVLPGVRSGALTIATTQEVSGAPDWLEAMDILGLVSYSQDRFDSPTPAEISNEIRSQFPMRVLQAVRSLFRQDSNGQPLDISRDLKARFSLYSGQNQHTVIPVGGDNGTEWGSSADREGGIFFNPSNSDFVSVVSKPSADAPFNPQNTTVPLDLSPCTPQPGTCSGVFDLHLIRRYANAATAVGEWRRVMGPFTPLAYSGVLNQTGFPIGTFPEDANVYLLAPQEVNEQTIPVEFHRERYWQMQQALDVWARTLAVHIARVAANAVGAQPDGIPPHGIYGSDLGLVEYFRSENAGPHRFQPWKNQVPENNVLKQSISFENITDAQNPIGFSIFEQAWWAGRMRVR